MVWVLLSIPGSLLVIVGILVLSAAVEGRVLSPRSMILSAARAKRTPPEFAEAFVAREFERLLTAQQR